MERRNKILRFLYVTIESALFAFIVMMIVLLLIFICISFVALQYVNMIIGINNQYLPEPTDFVLKAEEKDVIFSYYCPCSICCGENTGFTKSGTIATEGRTIAADRNIPFGSMVYDGNNVYIVEDRGSAISGDKFDVFVNSHEYALHKGIEKKKVWVITFKDGEENKWTTNDILQLLE